MNVHTAATTRFFLVTFKGAEHKLLDRCWSWWLKQSPDKSAVTLTTNFPLFSHWTEYQKTEKVLVNGKPHFVKQCLCQRWLCLCWKTWRAAVFTFNSCVWFPVILVHHPDNQLWWYVQVCKQSGWFSKSRLHQLHLHSPVWGQSSTTLKVLFLWLNAGNRSFSPSLFAVVSDHSVIPTQVPGRDPAQFHGQFLDQSLVSRCLKSHSMSGVTGQLFVGPDSRQNDLQSKRRDRKTHERNSLGLRNTQRPLTFVLWS